MNENSYVQEAVKDIETLVQKHIDRHTESYVQYSELVDKSKLGLYSLNGELREMCPLINVQKMMCENKLIGYDNKKLKHYANLDEVTLRLFQNYAEKIQYSKEKSLVDKDFNKWELEAEYQTATQRPYRLAKLITFGGSTVASAILLGTTLPVSQDINITALAEIMGTMIGGFCWVIESCYQPLGKILQPLEQLMMPEYQLKDMRGTSVYEEKLKKQYIRKLSNHIKKNYLENKMRA